jgi:hypothetical protein
MRTCTCSECGQVWMATRSDATTCGPTCRKRRSRREAGDDYVVTPEDRALIKRLCADPGHPLREPPTPEQVRAHVATTARRT